MECEFFLSEEDVKCVYTYVNEGHACAPLPSFEDICVRDMEVKGTSRKQALCLATINHLQASLEAERLSKHWEEVELVLSSLGKQAR